MNTIKEFNQSIHMLNHKKIDTLHKEFLDIYASADINSLESIIQISKELLVHSENHFHEEEVLMEKYNYPTIKEHKDEHYKALAEMEYFIKNSHSIFGKKMLKSYFIEKLPQWFDLHLANMDSDLVYHLNKFEH
ncbi:bacteriohemerythrin [Arcobacter sp. F2176]|uniref:bacteriohemerythrin n=1 Tax=Arcobacter sp. F2176 TaxID=2044511 RepID=UPI00100B7274|nr:hemerythrin family protein [Arcobacter sp. F2176]RXJ80854.1 hemerythrin [Arcobacter sp. F2176]